MLVTLTVPVSSLVVGLGGLVAVRSLAHSRPVVSPPTMDPAGRLPGADVKRVVVVVEENRDYAQIIDAPDAPFLNWLAQRSALLGGYFGGRHPSLPDSGAMLDANAFGIDCDCIDCPVPAPNLIDRLEAAGISWAAYLHGQPTSCPDASNVEDYAKQHSPFTCLDSICRDPQRWRKVVPFERFAADLASRRLPQFVFAVPDLRCDLRDDLVAPADDWFLDLCRPLAISTTWGGGDTRLVVTFNENRNDGVTCSPGYPPLRTTEEEFGLGYLECAADATTIPATVG